LKPKLESNTILGKILLPIPNISKVFDLISERLYFKSLIDLIKNVYKILHHLKRKKKRKTVITNNRIFLLADQRSKA